MILSHLKQTIREQNWFAIGLEIVIVVFSVVIAFQVTAWGNERANRVEEQELLRGLQGEFTNVVSALQAQVAKHRRVERAVSTTLEALATAQRSGAQSATVADTALAWAYIPSTTQFSQGILIGTLTTGRLGLIRDHELRAALSAWEGVLADVTEDEIASRDIVMHQLEPTMWRRMDVRPFRNYALLLGTLSASETGAISDVPTDPEIIGVLTTRHYWLQHVIQEFSGPQEEAHRILDLIDRSLE